MKIIFNEKQIKDICHKYRFENMLESDIADIYDVNVRKDKKLFKITYSCKKAEKFMNWIYDNQNVCLDRKYNKYLNYTSGKI